MRMYMIIFIMNHSNLYITYLKYYSYLGAIVAKNNILQWFLAFFNSHFVNFRNNGNFPHNSNVFYFRFC